MNNELRPYNRLKKEISSITMEDMFSNEHRSFYTENDDTKPNISEEDRDLVNIFLIFSPFYDGENWYGRQLVENHPKYIPEKLFREWYLKKLIWDVRINLFGQWFNEFPKYQEFLKKQIKEFSKEVKKELSKEKSWKEEKYVAMAICNGTLSPKILELGV